MLKDKITIVIPSKNEANYIHYLLDDLRFQGLGGAKIIIADCSTDNTRKVIEDCSAGMNIEIIEGGPVSTARNSGARLVTTPYILFIDADVRFFNHYTIRDAVDEMEQNDLDLIGLNIRCYDNDIRTAIGFKLFNTINHILKHFSPFAVGAFMLTRRSKFEELGGFPRKFSTSEDFFLSRKYDPKKFKILNHYFGQDSRRFKKMGYFGMVRYLIKNFLNRNNPDYWKQDSHSNYWK